MSGSDWRLLRALFDEALALPACERVRFVEGHSDTPREVRDEVLSLLAAHAEAGGFFDSGYPVLQVEVPERTAEEDRRFLAMRSRIGAFRVLSRIGSGGMGTVYLAERIEGGFEQRVAIKVVSEARQSDEIVRRFEFERRILSTLDHPGIARILDGGTTTDGLPYFVMELVEGSTLVEFAEAHGLDLPERLRLFLEVCDAVEHAHRRSVLHRDLKPGNILVDAKGHPKLLDFGISKLLDVEPGPGVAETVGGWMTPAWASPEQIRGEATTTASDVYSLGRILYELLADRPAVDTTGSSAAQIEGAILAGRYLRPSEAVLAATGAVPGDGSTDAGERRRRAHALAGDLDTIVLKAIASDVERRYGTVAELAEEIERHLGGRPILARPDSVRYRAAKFVRRHRGAVALGSLAALALVAGLTLALLGLVRARRAEAQARTESISAERVADFLVDLFRISDPGVAKGNAVTARELLDRGADQIGRQLADEPLVRARLLHAIGRAYGSLGLYDQGLGAFESELAILRAASFVPGGRAPALAAALTAIAEVESRRGNFARSLESSGEAVRLLEVPEGADRLGLARALSQQAIGRWYQGDLDSASRAMDRSLALRRELSKDDAELVGALNNAAILRWQLGDLKSARANYDAALAIAERLHGRDHPDVASTLNNLAILELEAGAPQRSRELHERALASRRELLAADHPDIGESLNNLGEALRTLHEPDAARAAFEEALALREKVLGPEHPAVATTLSNLGGVLVELGETVSARAPLERSLALFSKAVGSEHFYASYPLLGLAALEEAQGHPHLAEAYLARALALREASLGAEHADTRLVRSELARLRSAAGEKPGPPPGRGEWNQGVALDQAPVVASSKPSTSSDQ